MNAEKWHHSEIRIAINDESQGSIAKKTNRALTALVWLQPINTKYSRNADARDQWTRRVTVTGSTCSGQFNSVVEMWTGLYARRCQHDSTLSRLDYTNARHVGQKLDIKKLSWWRGNGNLLLRPSISTHRTPQWRTHFCIDLWPWLWLTLNPRRITVIAHLYAKSNRGSTDRV